MQPFRTRADDLDAPPSASPEVRDAVSQMVQQFADPFALYRELVQNSVDAGATAIDVRLMFDPTDDGGLMRVVVSDDGCGMNRDTIEQCLLVLFRSSKDRDPSKIGKFGVGFFSVFAVGPVEVIVATGTGDDGWRLSLRPDFSYEIVSAEPRRGTTVTIRVPTISEHAANFARNSLTALERWCQFVRVPLTFATVDVPEFALERTINRPFGVDTPVSHTYVEPSGAVFAVGAGGVPGASFYNRGLLLHKSDPILPDVTLAIDDPALSHTLSRDDVRRDAAFERAIEVVTRLARGPLRDALRTELARTAEAVGATRGANGMVPTELGDRFHALALVAMSPRFALDADELVWPLIDPLPDGRRAMRLERGFFAGKARYYAVSPSELTAALAAKGTPVVDVAAGHPYTPSLGGAALFSNRYGRNAVYTQNAFCLPGIVADDALQASERALLDRLRPILAKAGFAHVAFAQPTGLRADRMVLALPREIVESPDRLALVAAEDFEPAFLGAWSRRGLAIHRGDWRVRSALAAASNDPAIAAAIFARLVMLATGKLDESQIELLLGALVAESAT